MEELSEAAGVLCFGAGLEGDERPFFLESFFFCLLVGGEEGSLGAVSLEGEEGGAFKLGKGGGDASADVASL